MGFVAGINADRIDPPACRGYEPIRLIRPDGHIAAKLNERETGTLAGILATASGRSV